MAAGRRTGAGAGRPARGLQLSTRRLVGRAVPGTRQPADYWNAWFQRIAAPAPLPAWDQACRSQAGLARRHNTRAFLLVVYSDIRDSKNPDLTALIPAVTAALASVP